MRSMYAHMSCPVAPASDLPHPNGASASYCKSPPGVSIGISHLSEHASYDYDPTREFRILITDNGPVFGRGGQTRGAFGMWTNLGGDVSIPFFLCME